MYFNKLPPKINQHIASFLPKNESDMFLNLVYNNFRCINLRSRKIYVPLNKIIFKESEKNDCIKFDTTFPTIDNFTKVESLNCVANLHPKSKNENLNSDQYIDYQQVLHRCLEMWPENKKWLSLKSVSIMFKGLLSTESLLSNFKHRVLRHYIYMNKVYVFRKKYFIDKCKSEIKD